MLKSKQSKRCTLVCIYTQKSEAHPMTVELIILCERAVPSLEDLTLNEITPLVQNKKKEKMSIKMKNLALMESNPESNTRWVKYCSEKKLTITNHWCRLCRCNTATHYQYIFISKMVLMSHLCTKQCNGKIMQEYWRIQSSHVIFSDN